jgi:hypothetical protein
MNKAGNLLARVPFFFFLLPVFLFLHIENEYRHLINYHFVLFEMVQLLLRPARFPGLLLFPGTEKGSCSHLYS